MVSFRETVRLNPFVFERVRGRVGRDLNVTGEDNVVYY